ncbi:MAG: ribonucleotide-diphosphate reductase subunit alpha [Fibrobacteria bacterium]|jgi:ribonucleoside-diphosphate reductase alpha chain|nr:ribonucleotide-diphosphate reductase subunit alpha [Fibrobacteria bacterium]
MTTLTEDVKEILANADVGMAVSGLDPARYQIERRDGSQVRFKGEKIVRAITKAFLAQENLSEPTERILEEVNQISDTVFTSLLRRRPNGGTWHIEDIQDQVELALMRVGRPEVAKAYVLYRQERAKQREAQHAEAAAPVAPAGAAYTVTNAAGQVVPLDETRLKAIISEACFGYEKEAPPARVLKETLTNLFPGIPEKDVSKALVMVSCSHIEEDPAWTYVTARLLMDDIREEALGNRLTAAEMGARYPSYFKEYVKLAADHDLLDARLLDYDLDRLGKALKPERDLDVTYLGLRTLHDRYFVHLPEGRHIELLQAFWMRVAMGLSLNEVDREARAIEFYEVLSSFRFVSSTPTLFNSGTQHSQMSSCYLTTVPDDLHGIFGAIQDDAMLSKFAGGLGNDWTPVRALGSHIKGTNGKSQGIIPFLKVANDTAVAVNQGGRRKGAMCAYLETWHMDIEEFLDLRKNTGDDRRRTHDMNTANWIPDLFMKRVLEDGPWTLFSPNECPDLHDLYGKAFEERYKFYEAESREGRVRTFKTIRANDLWRKMLSMLYETGHPWMTFKDPSNLRSPQRHMGVVHSSNLCTEILLNTNKDEIAVCNLGSINLVAHVKDRQLNEALIENTVITAMRMLDNVIDLNYYPVPQARNSNLKHRPVGLGIMGFQDALYATGVSYASEGAVEFADASMEYISYYSILASSKLAKERGTYPSYQGSSWSKGLLPIDTVKIMEEERGLPVAMDASARKDWTPVREHIKQWGMRNSNCMAIAPTATISNIIGVSQSIEPTYKNLYVKSNLSGEFTVINTFLVDALKDKGLWDKPMVEDLKYFDGELAEISRIPEDIKKRFLTAFDVDPKWLIACAMKRQKWIDMGQSLNLYMAQPSGKKLDAMYKLAWQAGLKTTYYLRALGATQAEKSTLDRTRGVNAVTTATAAATAVSEAEAEAAIQKIREESRPPKTENPEGAALACSILNGEDCEACQ